jgi:hypothetical protein
MAQYNFNATLDIPVGHTLLNFGPVTAKNEKENIWAFAIGYNDDYNEPTPFCESPKSDYVYELAIILRKPEQAEAYADMFSKMATRMRETQKENGEKNE